MTKKSNRWISRAVAAAVVATTAGAVSSYEIPLSQSDNVHNEWILFGVSGYKIDGGSASVGEAEGDFTIAGSTINTAIDEDNTDGRFGSEGSGNEENGFFDSTNVLGKVKVLEDGPSEVEARVDLSNYTYSETDPDRTMYIDDGDGEYIAVTYKAGMEGMTLEYSTDPDATDSVGAKAVTLSSSHSWDNKAVGEPTVPDDIDPISNGSGDELTAIEDIVDMNLSDNPVDPTAYTKEDYALDINDTQELVLYSYNADAQEWEIHNSNNSGFFNDFERIHKGKGYWGRLDTNATTGNIPDAGVVVGEESDLSMADMELVAGEGAWNLMAFDDTDPDIRVATTGLNIDINGSNTVWIKDSKGVFDINLTSADLNGSNDVADAAAINGAIQAAKETGELPRSMNMFAVDNNASTDSILLWSNTNFIVEGVDYNDITGATIASDEAIDANITLNDLTNPALQSKFGEYFLIVEPNNAAMTDVNATFEIVGESADDNVTIGANAAATASNVTLSGFQAYPINVAGQELVMIAAQEPFYIRDHTFTRAFEYTAESNTTSDTVTVGQVDGASNSYSTAGGNVDTLAKMVSAIDGLDDTNATQIGTTNNLAVYNWKNPDFYVIEEVGDNLKPISSTADEVKGAIKRVYAANEFTDNLEYTNEAYFDFNTSSDPEMGAESNVTVSFTRLDGSDFNATFTTNTEYDLNTSEADAFLSTLVSQIEDEFAEAFISDVSSVEHSDTNGTLDGVRLTVTSADIKAFNALDFTDSDTNPINVGQNLSIIDELPDNTLTDDLLYNAVHAPNYVLDGPLYAFKDAGYKPLAITSGEMDMSKGEVKWSQIDLTNESSKWFDYQEYDLYRVDSKSGYWVYLEQDGQPVTLDVSNVETQLDYVQHFDYDGGEGTAHNDVYGQVDVYVENINHDLADKEGTRVRMKVGGSLIELTVDDNDETFYTGKISSTELKDLAESKSEILVSAADGTGYNMQNKASGTTVDYEKPAKPEVEPLDGANYEIASTSEDVVKYYVYDRNETSNDANDTLVGVPADMSEEPTYEIVAADAAQYNVCSELNYGDSKNYAVFALDGDGEDRRSGNASDVAFFEYTATYNEAVIMTDTNDGDDTPTTVGVKYDDTCAPVDGTEEEIDGMKITQDTEGSKGTISFQEVANVTTGSATPNTIYVANSAGTTLEIQYADDYAGEEFFYQIDEEVYRWDFPEAGTSMNSYDATTHTQVDGVTLVTQTPPQE